ncbi:MAG TPA: sigma-70 family RNA polymerase sigma factor [Candidatus Aquilonibacter sp.]|nr:sigma-70 family RNA polymerase sigma factor [Candidatus Aquilonibacter sp.]
MVKKTDELIATRTTLLQRLKDWQDQSSWQDFFDTYWNLIYSVALKAGLKQAEAQDAVQETMISVAKHMPGFKYDRSIGSFKAWLLQMTRWRIIDQIRKRDNLAAEDNRADTRLMQHVIDPVSQALDSLWDAEWEAHLLDAALTRVKRRLDPQKYQIFDFCVNKEWPADKVAATFGISVSQVYLAKHRVTELIAEEVKRLEVKII